MASPPLVEAVAVSLNIALTVAGGSDLSRLRGVRYRLVTRVSRIQRDSPGRIATVARSGSVFSQLIHRFHSHGSARGPCLPGGMPSLLLFLQHVGLVLRLHAAMPLDPLEATLHVQAAMAASTERVAPEVLLAIAFVESRYDPLAVSRVEGTKRVLGHYGSDAPPRRLKQGSSLYCGPLQTFAASWDDCLKQRDLFIADASSAKELERWLRDRRVRGDLTRALAGYGCGN